MHKIICFEGIHGAGKSTLIDKLGRILTVSGTRYAIVRDSEYPEFEEIKESIRRGILYDRHEIIARVAETRRIVYDRYINAIIKNGGLIILDRSYYTSAVWQADSDNEVLDIIAYNESKGIPQSHVTFIVHAPMEIIRDRLISRGRADNIDYDKLDAYQERYRFIASARKECRLIESVDAPSNLATSVYRMISENNAL